MERIEGFFNLYWDASTGSLFWEISEPEQEFLYQISMGSGLGSNPIGIDRGQLRGTHILRAQRVGPRILLVEPNYQYVAQSPNETEVQAVRDAFAPSVHWGFDLVAETDGRVLVNATQFFLRDARQPPVKLCQASYLEITFKVLYFEVLFECFSLCSQHGSFGISCFFLYAVPPIGN